MIHILRGLNIPLAGEASHDIDTTFSTKTVALIGPDYVGMKPTMLVKVGDKVKLGQPVFSDKKTEGVMYTAPGAGEIVAINRGPRRTFHSLVIKLDETEESFSFATHKGSDVSSYSNEEARALLIESGLWTAIRTRPFSKVPAPTSNPNSIFVSLVDTNPLAFDPEIAVAKDMKKFIRGLEVLKTIQDGKIFLTYGCGANYDLPDNDDRLVINEISRLHPAGNVGTQMNKLNPVHFKKEVWHLDPQDVLAIADLFETGKLNTERLITFAGPIVKEPRIIKTRIGADIKQLSADALSFLDARVICGSAVYGRAIEEGLNHLGRFNTQVTALAEGREREFLGMMAPGFNKPSIKWVFGSKIFELLMSKFNMTTSTNGSHRAIVPTGNFERVFPFDMIPTPLLKALATNDIEQAQALGCLELDEEDLALCTYVCSGKNDYGPMLRETLDTILKEG